ncbi:MBOAT family protein [Candidatus Pelagibacter sp.]|jgi:D-alanyl-lipoteichoic acid acyltransferase DltB (MBOAT superfamily)|nr:MBOAT family protein [Candidatus Pelagibacter sp.]
MLFHSHIFLFIFLPIVFSLYFLTKRFTIIDTKIILIFAGLIFYSWWNIYLAPLIIVSIIFNYFLGHILIIKEKFSSKKRMLLIAIFLNVLFLIIFKYIDFLIFNLNHFSGSEFQYINLPFPLAMSFFTFQTIAYLVDCYDGNIKKNSFKEYALFIIFFPQLIAGPIVSYNEMMSQFNNIKNKFMNFRNILLGLIIIFIGFFKKVIIADNLAIIVDAGFINHNNLEFFSGWLTSLAFTFQIYFDFSGYIDMAIGAALLFNIKLPINFNSPFKSLSMIDFWRRWHITLSNFLMNYIYFPWLKSLKSINFFKTMLVTFFVFIIAGIWHGPSWLYVIFGTLHGIGLIINHTFTRYFELNLNKYIAWFLTFNYVNLTLIFFRSKTLDSSVDIIKSMLGLKGVDISNLTNISLFLFIIFFVAIILSFCFKNTNYLVENYNKIIK